MCMCVGVLVCAGHDCSIHQRLPVMASSERRRGGDAGQLNKFR